MLESVAGEQFYNTSPLDFRRLLDDPANVAGNLRSYIAGFSPAARDVIEKFGFDAQIVRLDRANLLYLVVSQFAEIDLHPDAVSNLEMGYLYEELVRRFSELSNETAGEHFTPREVIRLMVNLLFVEDEDVLDEARHREDALRPGLRHGRDALDRRGLPARAESGRAARGLRPGAERGDVRDLPLGHDAEGPGRVAHRPGQLVRRRRPRRRARSTTCSRIRRSAWSGSRSSAFVKDERERLGFRGRFGAGLPRDQRRQLPLPSAHDLEDEAGRGRRLAARDRLQRLAALHRRRRLGPSEIRRWIIENDWLEAVVALPDQLFYNTGISTYFWVVTNRKSAERRGKVQLVDARELWVKMRKSLGEKRKAISPEQIEEITRLYGAFEENERVKIFRNEAVRLPADHGRAAAAAALHGRGRARATGGVEGVREARRGAAAQGCSASSARSRDSTTTDRAEALSRPRRLNGKLSKPEEKALLEALAVRDPEAPALDEPDPELRDQENVPLPGEPVDVRARPVGAARERAVPARGRGVHGG